MIGRLVGRLASKATDHVIVDVAGVGYLVQIPLSTFYELPDAESPASLWIHTYVREDALALYGFLTERERSLFLMLIGVAGIGPRVALTVLSGIPPAELVEALQKSDVRRLMAVPGVGKKTAERMVLELRDKLDLLPGIARAAAASARSAFNTTEEDVISALANFGVSRPAAEAAVTKAKSASEGNDFDGLFRRALKLVR